MVVKVNVYFMLNADNLFWMSGYPQKNITNKRIF